MTVPPNSSIADSPPEALADLRATMSRPQPRALRCGGPFAMVGSWSAATAAPSASGSKTSKHSWPEIPLPRRPSRNETARHDLVTAASLFDVAPEDLDEHTVVEAVREARERIEEAAATRYDGELVGEVVDLFERRAMAWVAVSSSTFTLSTGAGRVTLEAEDSRGDAWRAVRHERGRSPRILASGLPLDYAQGVAEDHVRASGAAKLVDRSAPWRRRPASEKQRRALAKWGTACPAGITAGEASDMLSALIAKRGRQYA